MNWLFVTGHVVDVVIAVIAAEAAWLIWRGEWGGLDIILRLGPGVLMLLALRAALVGDEWWWIALPLALSFPVHLADLSRGSRR